MSEQSAIRLPSATSVPDLGFEATIGTAIRFRAEHDGDVDFVVSVQRRMTFAEVEAASRYLARRLLAMGVGKGTRVGLYYSYSPEWIVGWLAASRIGALVVPFSTAYPPRELGSTMALSDVQLLLTADRVYGRDTARILSEALPELEAAKDGELRLRQAPFLRTICFAGDTAVPWATRIDLFGPADDDMADELLLASAEERVGSGDPAVVVYTSGSTAEPKGVVHTHGSVLRSAVIMPEAMRQASRGLEPKLVCGMPFFWVGGILSIAGALLDPYTLIVMEKFDPGLALELIERERATYVMAWPTLIERMRAHPDFAARDLESAADLVHGVADVSLLDLPEPGVAMHRGMSETMGTFVGVETKIIDSETGDELPDGAEGELCIRGYGVMAGMYNSEWRDVFDSDGWYHTGDRCFTVAGDQRVFFNGRFKDMIKSSGANVAPREVEVVIEELDEVQHCFVIGVADEHRQEAVTAVVVPSVGVGYDQQRVSAHAIASLSGYKVPTTWILAEPDTIPWLGSGKPDKRELRRLVELGALA